MNTTTQTYPYEIRVSWNPSDFWTAHNDEQEARREFLRCLKQSDGMQVDLVEHGVVIASACGLMGK